MKEYSPKDVLVIFGGNVLTGFADGTMVSINRETDSFTKHVGSQGEVTRVKSANKSAEIIIMLAQSSPSNLILSGIQALDELTSNGILPLIIKDLSGKSIYFSGQAWIRKPADSEFSDEITDREWALDCAEMLPVIGGN